ncbi:MAG: hypothetical protein ACTSQP_20780 [Promethearchaeota archaeon]
MEILVFLQYETIKIAGFFSKLPVIALPRMLDIFETCEMIQNRALDS